MENDIKAIGTSLTKIKKGSETQDWLVGSLTRIGEIKFEVTEEDVTTLDSPDRAKEYMPGDIEIGDVDFEGYLKKDDDEATITKMLALINSNAVESWEIKAPKGWTWKFDAFIKSFGTSEAAVDGKLGFSGSLKITGQPVFSPSDN